MRIVFTFLVTAVVAVMLVLDNPDMFRRVAAGLLGVTQEALWVKDVRIEGLQSLSRTEVERVLPLRRSVAWWRANLPVVQAKIAENPWIGSVAVEPCPDGGMTAWGCFVVSIVERRPAFLASVDNDSWIVSEDGTFIRPFSAAEEHSFDTTKLVAISGLASRTASPDLVRAQLALAKESIPILEAKVKRTVRAIAFEGKGDLAVRFEGLGFPVVFSTGGDSGVTLNEQAERCAKLLPQIAHRLSEVEKIDLAFSQVGIVKFR